MAKLEDAISRFLGGESSFFNSNLLIIIVIVFLVLGTDILEDLLEDDNMWVWIILVILLLFNFDDTF